MCQGNCSGCNDCAAHGTPGPPGRQGDPGATPTITATATTGDPGTDVDVLVTGTALNPNFGFLIPRGDPGAPGDPGTPAVNLYTTLTNAFTIPTLNSSTIATVGNTSWMRVGGWVKMSSGSVSGAYLYIVAVPTSTTVQLANMGSVFGWPDGVALQPAPGTVISPDSTPTQVEAAAVPGLPGTDGTDGDPGPEGPTGPPSSIQIVYSVPVAPPGSPEENFKFYANQTPPTPATQFVPYSWDGASWVAGPNVAGTPGAQTFFGTADPNIVAVPGSAVGDNYWQIAGGSATAYKKTTSVTWVSQGSISVAGSTTQVVTHTSPGTVTLDLAYFSFDIQADKDIELDWDDTNFSGQGNWVVAITNNDGSPIDLTFAASQWEEDPALSLTPPIAIAAGDVHVLRFIKDVGTGLYIFTSSFVPSAL